MADGPTFLRYLLMQDASDGTQQFVALFANLADAKQRMAEMKNQTGLEYFVRDVALAVVVASTTRAA